MLTVQGNNFTYTCNAQQSYINDICLTASAPSPAQLPPMGTTTAGSQTATGGLPSTNQTLPANNGSLPSQMQYPGAPSCAQLSNGSALLLKTSTSGVSASKLPAA